MKTTKQVMFAAVGAGDLAAEKIRKVQSTLYPMNMRSINAKELKAQFEKNSTQAIDIAMRTYADLVERGRITVERVRKAAPTKRAVEQTKVAKAQTKGAVTSAKKAAASTVEATKNAASSV